MNAPLRLKKGEERRLLAGHLWIFSNEIDVASTPLKSFDAGQCVSVVTARGDMLGTAYVNPHSLISARICSRDDISLSIDWFRTRLTAALTLRENLFDQPYYRLVHSEGDLLPGLIIDRYNDVVVVQVTTAGMEQHLDTMVEVLTDLLKPSTIYFRNDTSVRELEKLSLYRRAAVGELPETLNIIENGLRYQVSGEAGQKTGWFYDHRMNRMVPAPYLKGKRVLDGYCYAGAWGINALAAGAEHVTAIDASASATSAAASNAQLNGFQDRFETVTADVVETMRQMRAEGERFDVVILDPPAFIKRKKDYRAGLEYYALNNRLAASLLSSGGLLISASCSQSLTPHDLSNSILRAARKRSLELQILHELGQSPDHPVNAAMPETRYLKGFVTRLIN